MQVSSIFAAEDIQVPSEFALVELACRLSITAAWVADVAGVKASSLAWPVWLLFCLTCQHARGRCAATIANLAGQLRQNATHAVPCRSCWVA